MNWAVEFWEPSHWTVAIGGLTKREAIRQAKLYAKAHGIRVSIAKYDSGEGSSAVTRERVPT
jgi:hypothetical protein